ncbi:MAG: flagellar hook-length control protein FliK [Burkholderiales bacterium]|nr:flagellar hook-length control protein FliK [Burkholderiales bacterium]
MLPAELIGRLRLAVEASRVPALAGRVSDTAPVTPVRAIEAEVEALLPDGRYRVRAGERRFEVELPPGTRAGERVRLATGAASGPDTGGDPVAVGARLSATGRLVSRFAEGLAAGRPEGATPATQPLFPDAPADPARAAATLRELVALSGLLNDPQPRVVAWSGPVWPGQPMRWEVEERPRERAEAGEPPASGTWTTRVALDLARLGPVEARIALGAAGLAIRLAAAAPATGVLLDQRAGELAAALAGAGLQRATIAGASRARP